MDRLSCSLETLEGSQAPASWGGPQPRCYAALARWLAEFLAIRLGAGSSALVRVMSRAVWIVRRCAWVHDGDVMQRIAAASALIASKLEGVTLRPSQCRPCDEGGAPLRDLDGTELHTTGDMMVAEL